MNNELLEQLCQLRGIEGSYIDAWGNPAEVEPTSKSRILAAMGYPVDNAAEMQAAVETEIKSLWQNLLPNVVILRSGNPFELTVRVAQADAAAIIKWKVEQESGETLYGQFTPIEGELLESANIDGASYQAYKVELAASLELGYHNLTLLNAAEKPLTTTSLIIAPKACYKQGSIDLGKKVWGPSVQLYCLRSTRNWGMGDFTDLEYLLEQVAATGADFVGLNPIHALYPSNPESASPYSPSSRNWLNILYIDVEAIDEFAASEAKALVDSAEFKQRIQALRDEEWVDYTGVAKAKLETLKLVFKQFQKEHGGRRTARAKEFAAFVKAGGDSLMQQATFDALQEYFYAKGVEAWGWPAWPEEFQAYSKPAVAKFQKDEKDLVEFYLFAQWIADCQLEAADQKAKALGMAMGIYRDLAVGVSEGSTEVWANSDIYRRDASVGAPPDILGPLGQNWGLPPMDPSAMKDQGYQPFIDLLRANMSHCGALRIDHAMALLRLWWVPAGEDAKAGAYVYYPIDDLLGLLALESHRNQCLIIGEDLGTVPDGIFETLQENGVHSYRVFFFERSKEDGGFFSPEHYPVQAMATLTTHDMPTLRGFWHCDDLALGKELGLYRDEAVLQSLYIDRAEMKQRLLDSLHGHHSIPEWKPRDAAQLPMDIHLNRDMQVHMAKSASSLLALQLEDWLEMDKPVNVPGTSTEYPNWRRKLSHNLEELFAREEVRNFLSRISEARKSVSAG